MRHRETAAIWHIPTECVLRLLSCFWLGLRVGACARSSIQPASLEQ